jgi:hypothetical protein
MRRSAATAAVALVSRATAAVARRSFLRAAVPRASSFVLFVFHRCLFSKNTFFVSVLVSVCANDARRLVRRVLDESRSKSYSASIGRAKISTVFKIFAHH